MKKLLKRISAMLLFFALMLGSMMSGVTAAEEAAPADDGFYHGEMVSTTLWDANSQNGAYRSHRIPGIVVTKKDTVIVYCEARTGNTSYSFAKKDDWCLMDIFIQRSTDGGKTFGEPIYIAKGTQAHACVNNPVMIVGNDNTLHMLYCRSYSIKGGGLWYRYSTDDGLTWSKEREVSEFAESVPHDCFAFGPTHGISTKDGVLMAPVWLVPKGEGRNDDITSHGPSKTYVFYSKDNGATWALSEVASGNSNETDIAQLSDGSIILNSRATPRKITTSANGINGWTATYSDTQLPDPACCAGLVAVDIPGLPYMHLFSNCASETARDHVMVKCSFDDCVTYEKSLMISEFSGGYSDIAVDSKGKVYVLHEIAYGNRMKLVTFSLVDEFLSDNPLRMDQTTAFQFDSEEMVGKTISRINHLDSAINEGALRLTATETKKHSFYLDFSDITQNINLSKNRAIAFRVRVNSKVEGDCTLGTYFQSGRIYGSSGESYNSIKLPNDGQWHTVIMDLEEAKNVQGMLYGIRMELFSDTLRCEVGDTVDIESISFFENAEIAREALGLNEQPVTPTEETPAPTEPTAPVEEEKGCRSAASWLPVALMVLAGTCFLLLKGKKKSVKH